MKENKMLIFKAIAFITLLTSLVIIWVNMILKQPERTFKQEPLNASQIDDMMMEWNGYENEPSEVGEIVSQDIFIDNMEKGSYTKKGRLKNNSNDK